MKAKNITAQVLGGEPVVLDDAVTVEDALNALELEDGNYTATINGEPAEMEDELDDFSFVTFAAAVKAGC